MGKWSQERDVPKLKYRPDLDPKNKGWHYLWEANGFGAQVFRSGKRNWVQLGSAKDPVTGKFRSYFRKLGSLEDVKLADARIEGFGVKAQSRKDATAHPGDFEDRAVVVHRASPQIQIAASRAPEDIAADVALANTTLGQALQFYVDNRNCAPSSKDALVSVIQTHLKDWGSLPLLSRDSVMLKTRYGEVIANVQAQGRARSRRYSKLSAAERLTKAPDGYFTGIKTANDMVEGFGRIYRYWTTMHAAKLQRAGIMVPVCPADALFDDLEPEPHRVKSIPLHDLAKLFGSFSSYEGNELHPLLAEFLLASGLRVGITMGIKHEYIHGDRIVIPASSDRSKVRWRKRHLEHMAFVVPITPKIQSIMVRIAEVAYDYGDADTWLFPSTTSESGHMEEEKNAALRLRIHASVRFTMHQLRHNVGTAAERVGYRRSDVTEILQQAKTDITDRYIDERIHRHREMLIKINNFFDYQFAQESSTEGLDGKLGRSAAISLDT